MAVSSDDLQLSGLELVELLLRRVARGFYQSKHSILLDIVLKHSAVRDDHIGQMMGLQNQEVRKLCGRLREDRLLTMHTKQEMKEGQNRPVNRTYYYIDYRDAVDAIKYRVHRLVRTVEEQSKNDFDSRGYVCPYCQKRYGALDVLPLVSLDGQHFTCSACSTILVDDEESMESKVSQERLARLQKQTLRIVSTLKEIDASFVPDNDFISASANAIPPSLDMLYTDAFPHGIPSQTMNNNISQTTTAALGVTMDYRATQQDTPEEKARKVAQAQMNQLPEWHLQSTVSGEPLSAKKDIAETIKNNDVKEVQLDAAASDEVAEYYRSLRVQEQAESESDEDEEELEDVPTAAATTDTMKGELPTAPLASKHEEESDEEFEDV